MYAQLFWEQLHATQIRIIYIDDEWPQFFPLMVCVCQVVIQESDCTVWMPHRYRQVVFSQERTPRCPSWTSQLVYYHTSWTDLSFSIHVERAYLIKKMMIGYKISHLNINNWSINQHDDNMSWLVGSFSHMLAVGSHRYPGYPITLRIPYVPIYLSESSHNQFITSVDRLLTRKFRELLK